MEEEREGMREEERGGMHNLNGMSEILGFNGYMYY